MLQTKNQELKEAKKLRGAADGGDRLFESIKEAVYVSEHFPKGGGANDIIRSHAALQCYPAGDREREGEGEGGVRQVRQVSDDEEEEEEGFSEQQTVRHQCQAFLSV